MDQSLRLRLVNQFTQPDEKLLFSKVLNQACLCLKNKDVRFSSFLDPYRSEKYRYVLAGGRLDIQMLSYGGNDECERKIIGFFPDFIEPDSSEFPIDLIKITYDNRFREITHRDLLGSVLGLGIEREKIGDIIVRDGIAYCYAYHDIADYLLTNLEKVAHTSVRSSLVKTNELQLAEVQPSEKKLTVSSMRIDTILAHIFNLSRSKAVDFIEGEKVFINWQPVTSSSKSVQVGDTITLRGKGRAKIMEIAGKTKKDNIILRVQI